MTKEQVDLLIVALAKPVERHGQVVWITPLWLQVLRATARRSQ